ncbi:MAG: hypothetical protein EPO07_06285 [Verrucomicrobia bacterium]|nr:MAG: hypothetical protein EPO07_06285 [Verrucomicrobiota bacterium]
MSLDELIKQATSGEIPTGAMGGGGIIALLIALKMAKGFFKIIFILAALALLAGAAWWHFHKH